MKAASWAWILIVALVPPANAGNTTSIERMATCQDSWVDWTKHDPARMKAFGDDFRADFSHSGNDAFATPKKPKTVAGLNVSQVFPESVGMGVGFSVTVDAPFDETKRHLEKMLGKAFAKCEAGDGMHSCERQIAEQRTLTLMAEDNAKSAATLVGCYYFYEK
jgi:hypothetical protein